MSSVVKKPSQFTPKVKRRPVRGSVLTPPTTQEPSTQASVALHPQTIQPPESPERTQTETQTLHADTPLQEETPQPPRVPLASEEDVDPKDASQAAQSSIAAVDPESGTEADEYGDNDIFKKPYDVLHEAPHRRRSSVAGHRRLSGITAFRRSGSVSGAAGVPADSDSHKAVPVLIGIPVARPVKRRASVARGSRKAPRSDAPPLASHHETPEQSTAAVAATTQETDPSEVPQFVYGIHPELNRLVKFKTLESLDSSLEVAPADMRTTVASVEQLPTKFSREDWELYAQVQLSDDMLMEDLCRRTLPFGSTSDNYERSLQARTKIRQNQLSRRLARDTARRKRISYEAALASVAGGEAPQTRGNVMDEPDVPDTGLRVTLVNNKISLDQDSTMVRKQAADAGNRVVEIENAFENPITSSLYSRLAHTDAWRDEEVETLYRALSAWGTDFTFIAQMFPHRTRRQIKRKFMLEEKQHPQLVELALRRQLLALFYDFERGALSKKEWRRRRRYERLQEALQGQQVPEDEEGEGEEGQEGEEVQEVKKARHVPPPAPVSRFASKAQFELEMAELRREHQRHIEEITTERERAIKEDLEASRKREIEMRTGAKPMTRSQMKAEFKKNEVVVGTLDGPGDGPADGAR